MRSVVMVVKSVVMVVRSDLMAVRGDGDGCGSDGDVASPVTEDLQLCNYRYLATC